MSTKVGSGSSQRQARSAGSSQVGAEMHWDDINSPGAYILQSTGQLVRVPPDAIISGRSPALEIVSHDETWVRKISENPYITKTKAAMICSNNDIAQNFA